jgi:hypothetical protein
MKYEKPVVMDLNSRARRAAGMDPLACVSGPAATGFEACGTGTGAGFNCLAGTGGAGGPSCLSGGVANGGDCISGASAIPGYCSAGGAEAGSPDPNGCSAGPAFT